MSPTSTTPASSFVQATLQEVAFHLSNLAIALDPECIVVGGGIARAQGQVLPYLAAHLQRFVPFPPALAAAHFAGDAGLMGAIAVGLGEMDHPA